MEIWELSYQRSNTSQFKNAIKTWTELLHCLNWFRQQPKTIYQITPMCFQTYLGYFLRALGLNLKTHHLLNNFSASSNIYLLFPKHFKTEILKHNCPLGAQFYTDLKNLIIFHESTTQNPSCLTVILSFAVIALYTLWSKDICHPHMFKPMTIWAVDS